MQWKYKHDVAKHILLGDTYRQVCGFCGVLHSGNIRKIITRNNNCKPFVECPYYYELSYKSVLKMTKSNPSSNRPEDCKICKSNVWSYDMILHYQDKHPGVACPMIFSEEEKEKVSSFNF